MSSLKVYKASAGSGKTFTLAIQYIRLLITSDPTEYLRTTPPPTPTPWP